MSNQSPYNADQRYPQSGGRGQRSADAYRRGGGRYGVSEGEGNRQYVNGNQNRQYGQARNYGQGQGYGQSRSRADGRGQGYASNGGQRYQSTDSRRSSRNGRTGVPSSYGQEASRYGYSSRGDGYSQSRGRSASKPSKRKLGLGAKIAIGLGCLILLAGIGVFAYAAIISANLHDGVDDDLRNALVDTDYAKEPFYMLLMGVDTSAVRGAEGYSTDDSNSDSMMLARIDCPNHKVTMVSLHRDTLVMINGELQKINAAHAIGGAALAVETVSEFCGVDISHYAEINFDAFCDLVNSVGGVEVEVTMEINDEDAGGYVAAGRQTLDGNEALILCRARHAYDEYGDGDVYRAANQRMVLGALAKKILKADVLTIANSVQSCSKYVTTDMSITDIIGIAQAMKDLDPSTDIYSGMEPTEGVFYEGDGWYEEVLTDEWNAMMARVRAGLPPTESDKVSSNGAVLASTGSGEIDALN